MPGVGLVLSPYTSVISFIKREGWQHLHKILKTLPGMQEVFNKMLLLALVSFPSSFVCSQVNNLTKSPEILRYRVIFNIKKTESTLYSSWHVVSNHQMIQMKRQGEGATTVRWGTENSRQDGQEDILMCTNQCAPLSFRMLNESKTNPRSFPW